ncbi:MULTISPECIES: hypothetical protein [unclassified Microbacterium]|uniref:hypothetical protein n=1 Tax=unclassified Microbacterium TaxID=2609290 RepID=UPI00364B0DD1
MSAWTTVAAVAVSAVTMWLMTGPMLTYVRHVVELSSVAATGTRVPPGAVFGIVFDMMPGILTASMVGTILGWALYALAIVAGYRDYVQLGRLGYPKRFHWAWSFLSPVYPIGRAVVVRRQAGSGSATMWIALGATAASLLLSLGWSFWLMFAMFDAMRAGLGTIA